MGRKFGVQLPPKVFRSLVSSHLMTRFPNITSIKSSPKSHSPLKMVVEMVPLKGGIGSIVHPPIGRKNTTYIPLIVLALPGGLYNGYIYPTDPTELRGTKASPTIDLPTVFEAAGRHPRFRPVWSDGSLSIWAVSELGISPATEVNNGTL